MALCLLSALLPATAHAGEFEEFARAQAAYDEGDFPTAVQRFEGLVGGAVPRLTQRVLILESRKYLGASYFFVDRRREAANQFELLLQEEEDYSLDPVLFPAQVVQLFATIRARVARARQQRAQQAVAEETRRRQQAAARLLRERERWARLRDLAATETVEHEHSRLLATVPFGAGQFQNGDKILGWTLLISEGVLLATGTTAFFIRAGLPHDPNRPPMDRVQVQDLSRQLRLVNWISMTAFAAAALGGVIEAHIRFAPSDHETRRRELPADLDTRPPSAGARDEGAGEAPAEPSAALDLSLGPTSFSARLRF